MTLQTHTDTGPLDTFIDPALVEQAMAMITQAQSIALIAHEHPDGDCLGSAFGLAHILRQMGKTCFVACADPAPATLAFMPGIGELHHTLEGENFDLVIALDANELPRFGSLYTQHRAYLDSAPILNIDHHLPHLTNNGCGQVNIIDPTAAATAELLVLFQQQAGLPISRDAAVCLLTGIITDTSSYQFTNTTPRTMEVSAYLMRQGAIPEQIVQPIFRTRPLAQERFRAQVIANAQTLHNGRIIWSFATAATLTETGATPDMDDNSSGMLRDIEGVQIAAFLKSYDDPAITRLSLRSAAPYNAADLCRRIANGGGHARAAGATIPLPMQEAIPHVLTILEGEMDTVDALNQANQQQQTGE